MSGIAAFKWSMLDITRGPSLPREADKVVKLHKSLLAKFERSTTREEKEVLLDALDALRTSIEQRVEQLEQFYLEHDTDERAILFEKQRLKLRRLLHSDSADSKNARANAALPPSKSRRPPVPPQSTPSKTPPRQQQRGQRGQQGQGGRERRKKRGGSAADRNAGKSYEREPKLAYSTNKSPKDRFDAELKTAQAKMKSRVEPIYPWEKADGAEAKQKIQLYGPVEFQLRLTEQEFFKFCSKRRERAAFLRHKKRNVKFGQKECKFLQMQGPYVDPPRIMNSIYRSPDKSKWIDPKGIRGYQHL